MIEEKMKKIKSLRYFAIAQHDTENINKCFFNLSSP